MHIERNLGEQPLRQIMEERGLNPHDLVEAADGPLTHKMVSRACKGRRLTPRAQVKVRDALNRATGESFTLGQLFSY